MDLENNYNIITYAYVFYPIFYFQFLNYDMDFVSYDSYHPYWFQKDLWKPYMLLLFFVRKALISLCLEKMYRFRLVFMTFRYIFVTWDVFCNSFPISGFTLFCYFVLDRLYKNIPFSSCFRDISLLFRHTDIFYNTFAIFDFTFF